jgi:hypothetical protein
MAHPKPKGAIAPPPDERDYQFRAARAHYGVEQIEVPDVIDLRGRSPVGDQMWWPTCVGFSMKALMETLYYYNQSKLTLFSGRYAYKRANMLDNTLQLDQGADPRSALLAAQQFGIATEYADPYNVDTSDTTPPTPAEDTDAAQYKLGGFHACPQPQDAALALAARCPIIVTVRAGQAFDADAEARAYILSNTTLNDAATPWNHEQVIMGATGGLDPNKGWWLCQGTWGTGLFGNGYYCVPKAAYSSFFYSPFTASLRAVQKNRP